MKQFKVLFTVFIAALFLGGCASSGANDVNERPTWIDNANQLYPEKSYLTAVGEASTRNLAGKNALANLTEIFSVTVNAESKSLTESVKQQSAVGVTMQSSSSFNRQVETNSEHVIEGVEIKESWLSPQGRYYALAVLDKLKATTNLRETISRLDQQSADKIDYSLNKAPNVITSINALREARDIQMSRQMANTQLKYISGIGMGSDLSSEKIEQLITEKLAALKVTVDASDEQTKSAIESGLSAMGIKLVDNSSLLVKAVLDTGEAEQINGWYWLRGSYELSLLEDQKVISRKRWPIKVSAQQQSMLATRLQDKLSQDTKVYLQELVSDTPTP